MMKKSVPFYANHDDNMHCALAVYRMLFDYFLDRKLSWEEVEKMSGFGGDKAAWTLTMWQRMSNQGFDLRMIERFDYQRYLKEGDAYLRSYYNAEAYDWMVTHSNILEIQPLISNFLSHVKVESRSPTLSDIDDMLRDGRLVFLTLNARKLNDQDGYSDHAVLVIDKNSEGYIIHDPGITPRPNRHVTPETLWAAMGGDANTSEATGVKFKPRPMRADVILANAHPLYSRAALAKLFDKGLVTYNGKVLKTGDKLPSDARIVADLSSLQVTEEVIDLPILYEDDDVVVINKPAGVLTHVQGAFNPEATVASFLRRRTAELTGERAGIVHRLDRPTSGVLIGAKNPKAMAFLQKQFADRTVEKVYVAVVEGHLRQKEAVIDMAIERNPKAPATFRVGPNGKSARTRYVVLSEGTDTSLVELHPETGRTHQLRVHLAQLGHAIVGDPLYGQGHHGDRLYLHAKSLAITLPNGKYKVFVAPLPPEFEARVSQ